MQYYNAIETPSLAKSLRSNSAKLLLAWPIYFVMYLVTEKIPISECHVIHCALDDMIPFNEYFAIFYFLWYPLVFGSLLYLFIYDIKSFAKLQTFIIITQVLAMAVYIIYPSIQTGRPEIIGDNICCNAMRFIYSVDTPTGVCPSLHVAYSLGLISVWVKRKKTPVLWQTFVALSSIMICLPVVFVKQHSVIDVMVAIPVSLIAEYIVFGRWYQAVFRLTKIKIKKEPYPLLRLLGYTFKQNQ